MVRQALDPGLSRGHRRSCVRRQRPCAVPVPSFVTAETLCVQWVWGEGPRGSDVGKTHAVHSQIPPGGQVLNGAKASHLQEQLDPVDWEQKEAVSRGSDHGLSHTWVGSVSPSETLPRSPASPTGHVTPTTSLPRGMPRPEAAQPAEEEDAPSPSLGPAPATCLSSYQTFPEHLSWAGHATVTTQHSAHGRGAQGPDGGSRQGTGWGDAVCSGCSDTRRKFPYHKT